MESIITDPQLIQHRLHAAKAADHRREIRLVKKFEAVIRHAKEFHDSHFYIFSFTTHYKGGFGTPDLDYGAGRDEVWSLEGFDSVEELLDDMLTPICGCVRLTGGHV
jgi:hypothetical protein